MKLKYLNTAYMLSESEQQGQSCGKLRSRERAKREEDLGRDKGARRGPGAREWKATGESVEDERREGQAEGLLVDMEERSYRRA